MSDEHQYRIPGDEAEPRQATAELEPILIEGRNLYLAFGDNQVLSDISFQVREGDCLSIVGASGVGKSTILKLVLRLLVPDRGYVVIEAEDINQLSFEEVLNVRQKMGMVFQAAALFDSLSIYENVAFPLREHMSLPEDEVHDRVERALAMVDLSVYEFGYRLPAELSGGQKKRVGIARAIVHEPKILLYDEPTTGLDPVTSRTIVDLILRLQRELEVTSVVVSHDMRAVMAISTHVAMLRNGRIMFYGTPKELLEEKNPYVREFID
ncbi:MAG: ATP-binding cassette domain-containing protein [Gemmatimonadales bacterium]|jgi:phospholipid/cholesterol/gamma-HCH transport system ATP-binding protein